MLPDKTFHEIEHEAWTERASTYDDLFSDISSQAIAPILDSFGELNGKHHLDIACGTGHLVGEATTRGAISIGTDFAETMIEVASQNYPHCTFNIADANELPYDDHTFDAVSCAFGLLHMEHPQQAINETFRVLKPGGIFTFTLWLNTDEDGIHALIKPALLAHGEPVNLPESWTLLKYPDEPICKRYTDKAGFMAPQFEHIHSIMEVTDSSFIIDFIQKLSVRTNLMINSQTEDVKNKIFEKIISETDARKVDGVLTIGWSALLTSIQKPE